MKKQALFGFGKPKIPSEHGFELAVNDIHQSTGHPLPEGVVAEWRKSAPQGKEWHHGWNHFSGNFNKWLSTPEGEKWNNEQAARNKMQQKTAFWAGFEKQAKIDLSDIERHMSPYGYDVRFIDKKDADLAQKHIDEATRTNFAIRHPWLAGLPTLGLWPLSARSNAIEDISRKVMRESPTMRRIVSAANEASMADLRARDERERQHEIAMMPKHIEDRKRESYENMLSTAALAGLAAAGRHYDSKDRSEPDQEKQARARLVTPLTTQAAKDEYTREATRRARIGGGITGAAGGGAAGLAAGKAFGRKGMVIGGAGGALAGALGLGTLGHYLGKRRGERHGKAGVGVEYFGDIPDALVRAKHYANLNKEGGEK